jgi:hypothetical protein
MQKNRHRLRRGAFVFVGASTVAVLATGLIPVAAQVIGDPLGLISVGTSGESTNASALAVSNGGNASAGTGAGVSTTGSASGSLAAVSGTGCASTGNTFAFAPVAASGTGCAGGQGTTVSGTGTACGSGLVGVSAGGDACGFAAIAGNRASGTYYADGYGEAAAEGNPLVGNTGVSPIYSPPTADQIQATAAKAPELAKFMPSVVENLALGAASTASLPTTLTSPVVSVGVVRPNFQTCPQFATCSNYNAPPSYQASQPLTNQKNYWSCGSAATEIWWWMKFGSDPGESRFYQEEQDYNSQGQHTGTSTGQIAQTIDDQEGHRDMGQSDPNPDTSHLQGMVVTDEWEYNEDVIANVNTGDLAYWNSPDGTPHAYGHMITFYGYDSDGGGHLYIADTYDSKNWWSNPNWDPYGYHPVLTSVVSTAIGDSIDKDVVW